MHIYKHTHTHTHTHGYMYKCTHEHVLHKYVDTHKCDENKSRGELKLK